MIPSPETTAIEPVASEATRAAAARGLPADCAPRHRRCRRRRALRAACTVLDAVAAGGTCLFAPALTGAAISDARLPFVVGASAAVVLWLLGFYTDRSLRSRRPRLLAAAPVALVAGGWMLAISGPHMASGLLAAAIAASAAALSIVVARVLAHPVVRALWRTTAPRTLVVGAGARAARAGEALEGEPDAEVTFVGFAADLAGPIAVPRARYRGDLKDVFARCAAGEVDRVVVAREDLGRDDLVRLAQSLVATGVEVLALSPAFEVFEGRVRGAAFAGAPALRLRPTPLGGIGAWVKRAVDVAGALIGMAVLSPLLLAIALAVRLSSPGPVLYAQERVGRDGRTFTFLKFRSMIAGAPSATHREYVKAWMSGEAASTDEAGRRVFKIADDPRITRVGRFLRRTSLDELPQLLNVLRGEMSLVGPRPCMPYERELFDDWQARRLDVTPGCTGLWQVTARSSVGFQEMVLLDLHYIGSWSLPRDFELIARTLPVMLFGEGGL